MRLFDLHCDTLYECWKGDAHLGKNRLHVDLARGRRFDKWGQVFAVWMPDELRGEAAFEQCCAILDFAGDQAAVYADQMVICRKGEELDDAWRDGRCAAVLAVEGGSALAGRLDNVRRFAEMGVKIITLTWNGSNELGHGCGSGCAEGLTPFGRSAVGEMERLGILPDVSHLNERGFWDVAAVTTRPFIASHSVSAAVNPHPRNLTDAQFEELRRRGGLVGLNLCREQLGGRSFDQLERHLYHFLERGGERILAFGCDLDGTDLPPEWNGIAVMERLYDHLARKNYDETCLERLFFGNCSDFFSQL